MNAAIDPQRRDPHHERGSALVLALLVAFVVSLMGTSFLMMAQTESQIARNERLGAQAFYAADSAAHAVKGWFDRPGTAFGFPGTLAAIPLNAVVDRTQRRLIDETDPYGGTPTQQDGSANRPTYKQGTDDLFDRPFRGGRPDTLLGTREGPDMLIAGPLPVPGAPLPATSQGAFLDSLGRGLWGDYPGKGLLARIAAIRVYAPPYVEVGATWSRYGMATIEVEVRIDRISDSRVLARRTVKSVLNEAPYEGPYGPLHSCGDLTMTGTPTARWGAVTAQGRMKLFGSGVGEIPVSLPRRIPDLASVDVGWSQTSGQVSALETRVEGQLLDDPWFRALAGGKLVGAPGSDEQPYPSAALPVLDHSNLFQNLAMVGCPEYDYRVWKAVANSGSRDARYFNWAGSGFQENGEDPVLSFETWTNGQEGVFFFDTTDARPPVDDDGDGKFDNLTPRIVLNGAWSFSGFLYLNAESFQTDGVTGVATVLNAPAENYLDEDGDDQYTFGDDYINLAYPTVLADPSQVDRDDYYDETLFPPLNDHTIRNSYGPDIASTASLRGILYTSGLFEASGTARHYGSIVARTGVVQAVDDGSALKPELVWDARIAREWPVAGAALPRTIVTNWGTWP